MPLLTRKKRISSHPTQQETTSQLQVLTEKNTSSNNSSSKHLCNGSSTQKTPSKRELDDDDDELQQQTSRKRKSKHNRCQEPATSNGLASEMEIMNDENSHNICQRMVQETTCINGLSNSYVENDLHNSINVVASDDRIISLDGDVGHIQEIHIQNFMCHENYKQELGARINLIHGPNGSGKSAILIAIVLGLGGRASCTNRASGMGAFVKSGQNRAKIMLKLCNYVSDPNSVGYQVDRYGKSIIIERIIYASGTSCYKLKSENGKTISEKKEDLDLIIKHFNILIDNPICVLTQEVSKNFLNSKNANDKFKLYMKATQLEDVKLDYFNAMQKAEEVSKLLMIAKETLNHKNKRLEAQKKKVEIIHTVKTSITELTRLYNESLWANLNEKHVDIERKEKELQGVNTKHKYFNDKLESLTNSVSELEQRKTSLESKLKSLSDDIVNARNDFDETREAARDVRRKLTDKESSMRVLINEVNTYVKGIEDLQKRIDGIEALNQNGQEVNIEAEIAKVREAIDSKRQEESDSQSKLNSLKTDRDEFARKKQFIYDEDRRLKARINASNSEIERLLRIQKNRLDRFGVKTSEIVAAVEAANRAGKFRKRPYGPIGEFIRLEDFSAAVAVECCLKVLLRAYVVDNFDDMRTLSAIFARILGNDNQRTPYPEIIVRQYKPQLDTSQKEVNSEKYQNFIQLLNIKEPEIVNCLIDNAAIERTLYIPDYMEALNLLSNSETAPRKLHLAYTQAGDVMYPANNNQDFKCYPNRSRKGPSYLMKDCNSHIEQYKRQIEQYNREISSVADQLASLRTEIDGNKRQVETLEININELRNDISDLEKELRELKSKTRVKPVEVLVLKEEILKMRTEKSNLQQQIDAMKQERDDIFNQFKEIENEVDLKKEKYQEISSSRSPISEEIETINRDLAKHEVVHNNINKKIEEVTNLEKQLEEKVQEMKNQYEISRNFALEKTKVVVTTNQSYKDLLKEIERIQLVLKENKSIMDDGAQNQIMNDFRSLSEDVHNLNVMVHRFEGYYAKFLDSISLRKWAYRKLCQFIALSVSQYFETVLSQKRFTGSIGVYYNNVKDADGNVINKAQTLELIIRPREERQFFSQRDSQSECRSIYSSTKSLSGGERSYSTVAFIISLWQICSSPIKILDEVDVFMDMMTRKISLDTLIEFATFQSNKQFIFLSPLQIPHIHRPECVRVFEMPQIIRD